MEELIDQQRFTAVSLVESTSHCNVEGASLRKRVQKKKKLYKYI